MLDTTVVVRREPLSRKHKQIAIHLNINVNPIHTRASMSLKNTENQGYDWFFCLNWCLTHLTYRVDSEISTTHQPSTPNRHYEPKKVKTNAHPMGVI